MTRRLLLWFILLLPPIGYADPAPPFLRQPTSFTGVLPCADCPGIVYRLNLFPDRAFFLATAYQGRGEGAVFFDIGSWDLSSNGRVVILQGGRASPLLFRVTAPDVLTKLDLDGVAIDSALDYTLRRSDVFEPIGPRLPMHGHYRYLADAGLFAECLTGRRWPVLPVEDNLRLERAYLAAGVPPGEPLLVSLEAGIEVRQGTGPGARPVLIPYRFIASRPGEACPDRFATLALEGPRWRVVQFGGGPVLSSADTQPPELVFHADPQRVAGGDGCHRLTGTYRLDGDRLRFDALAVERIACAADTGMVRRFADSLAGVDSWNVLGRRLELYDAQHKRLMRLEADLSGDQ